MVKHTHIIRQQFADELFECVFDHFVGLAFKGLKLIPIISVIKMLTRTIFNNFIATPLLQKAKFWIQLFKPTFGHCSHCIPFEKTRKPIETLARNGLTLSCML